MCELSFVDVSIAETILAESLGTVVDPGALEGGSVWPGLDAETMSLVALPLAFVGYAVDSLFGDSSARP